MSPSINSQDVLTTTSSGTSTLTKQQITNVIMLVACPLNPIFSSLQYVFKTRNLFSFFNKVSHKKITSFEGWKDYYRGPLTT